VGALWTGSMLCSLGTTRRSSLAAGAWAAVAVLVRPNLLPVTAAAMLPIMFDVRDGERWRRAALFCAPLVPAAIVIALLNDAWHGSPLTSGYGAAGEIYHLSNAWPNLKLYASWLWMSQSPWVLLALVPLVPWFGRDFARRATTGCVVLCAATLASYVFYGQFDAWWYLRFLMPAIGALAVLTGAGLVSIARAVPRPFAEVAGGAVLYLMLAATLSRASEQGVFGRLRAGERRYAAVGDFAADHLPSNALFFAMQHSGSLRFYAGRPTLRYDWVQKEWAAGVPVLVEHAGYHPYLIIDDWELRQVRVQFGMPDTAPLPWPIVARMPENGGVTIFDMATRPERAAVVTLAPGTRELCGARRLPGI